MQTEIFTPNTAQHIETINYLDLKPEWLQRVGMRALAAHNQTTTFDAAIAPGLYAYLSAVRALREILCPEGWGKDMRHNVEMVTNPTTKVSIMVSSGDKDTGIKSGKPQTKNTKGNKVKKIISVNREQLQFDTMQDKITNISRSRIWMLLFHIDTDKSQMRLELSLPREMDLNDERVVAWVKRVMLPSIDFSQTPPPVRRHQEFTQEVPIELKRKSNAQ